MGSTKEWKEKEELCVSLSPDELLTKEHVLHRYEDYIHLSFIPPQRL